MLRAAGDHWRAFVDARLAESHARYYSYTDAAETWREIGDEIKNNLEPSGAPEDFLEAIAKIVSITSDRLSPLLDELVSLESGRELEVRTIRYATRYQGYDFELPEEEAPDPDPYDDWGFIRDNAPEALFTLWNGASDAGTLEAWEKLDAAIVEERWTAVDSLYFRISLGSAPGRRDTFEARLRILEEAGDTEAMIELARVWAEVEPGESRPYLWLGVRH